MIVSIISLIGQSMLIKFVKTAIVKIIKANPNVAIAAIIGEEYLLSLCALICSYIHIEPDSLPNLVTNSDLATCQASASGYETGVAYALKNLNLPNVAQ